MSKSPAFQFYTGDHMKDPNLSMCAPATRGIWMDLLCAMHESNRSGQITGTPQQLSRFCRCTAVEFSDAIADLTSTKTANVTERNGIVTVVCRRMQKEAKARENNNLRVKKFRGNDNVTDLKQESNNASSSSSSSSSSFPNGKEELEHKKNTRAREFGSDNLVNPDFKPELEETLHWLKQKKNLNRLSVVEWEQLLSDLAAEDIDLAEFKQFYLWVEKLDWTNVINPRLLRGQVEAWKNREAIAAKKLIGKTQNGKPKDLTPDEIDRINDEYIKKHYGTVS